MTCDSEHAETVQVESEVSSKWKSYLSVYLPSPVVLVPVMSEGDELVKE